MFIMVDGVDGSGKSTMVRAWRDMLEARNHRIFDAIAFEKATGRLAAMDDIGDADTIVTAEPGHAGVAKKIRDEMVKPGSPYSAREITEAFAEQRLERYEALIVPAIQKGLLIIQDRGVTTSLAYQPTMGPEITEEFVASLPGNEVAIEYRPDYVVICEVSADTAMQRIRSRRDKDDNAIFEQREYIERLTARYRADSWKYYLTKQGTTFLTFNTEQPIALMTRAAHHLLLDLI